MRPSNLLKDGRYAAQLPGAMMHSRYGCSLQSTKEMLHQRTDGLLYHYARPLVALTFKLNVN